MSEGVSTEELERIVSNLEELTREDGRKHRLFGYEVVAGLLPYVREALANRKASAWQPIETAPKDGSVFIVPGGIAHWYNGCFHSLTGLDWPGRPIDWHADSAWMPFPAPPRSLPSNGDGK